MRHWLLAITRLGSIREKLMAGKSVGVCGRSSIPMSATSMVLGSLYDNANDPLPVG